MNDISLYKRLNNEYFILKSNSERENKTRV